MSEIYIKEVELELREGCEEIVQLIFSLFADDLFEVDSRYLDIVSDEVSEYELEACLRLLAPYVGGYVTFEDVSGTLWKYELKNGKFVKYEGRYEVVYSEKERSEVDGELAEAIAVKGFYKNNRYTVARGKHYYLVHDRKKGEVFFIYYLDLVCELPNLKAEKSLKTRYPLTFSEISNNERNAALNKLRDFDVESLKEVAAALLQPPMRCQKWP